MRWRERLALLVLGALAPLGLAGCLGVADQHSTLVRQVPVKLVFKATPTPSPSAAASAAPAPAATP